MAVHSDTKKALRRVAHLAVNESDSVDMSAYRGGRVPEHLRREEDTEESWVSMWGDEARAFDEAFVRLLHEPEVEHEKPEDVKASLWAFVCELTLERDAFKDARERNRRVDSFLEAIIKPHVLFQVAVPIENLVIETEMDIGGVRLEHWGTEQAKEWAVQQDLTSDFVDRTMAIAPASAGTAQKAVGRARVLIAEALHLLRFGYPNSVMTLIRDNEVMFRQGSAHIAKEAAGFRMQGWSRGFAASVTSLPESLIPNVKQCVDSIERLAQVEPQTEMGQRFARAIHWLGSARILTDYDEKLVLICTALESLLAEESDRQKGALIALRAMLLQIANTEHFEPPMDLLSYYEKRSHVVHGAKTRQLEEEEYYKLLYRAMRLVKEAARLASEHPEVASFRQFRGLVEKPEQLERAAQWLDGSGKLGEEIAAEARRLLSEQSRRAVDKDTCWSRIRRLVGLLR